MNSKREYLLKLISNGVIDYPDELEIEQLIKENTQTDFQQKQEEFYNQLKTQNVIELVSHYIADIMVKFFQNKVSGGFEDANPLSDFFTEPKFRGANIKKPDVA